MFTVAVVLLVTVAGAAPPIAGAGAVDTLSMLTLTPKKGACLVDLHGVGTGVSRRLFSAPSCPRELVLDLAHNRAVSISNGALLEHPLDGADGAKAAGPKRLARAPHDDAELWLDASGSIRVRYAIAAEERTEKGVLVFRGDGVDLVVPQIDGASVLPPWGSPAVAVLAELQSGAWKTLERAPTRTEAGDTPGVSVLRTPQTFLADSVRLDAALHAMTCGGPRMDCASEDSAVLQRVGGDLDGAGTLMVDATRTLAFGVAVGDSAHPVAPVLLCSARCASSVVLVAPTAAVQQLGVAVLAGHIVIADEYEGTDARVFDASGRLVWTAPPGARAAGIVRTSRAVGVPPAQPSSAAAAPPPAPRVEH